MTWKLTNGSTKSIPISDVAKKLGYEEDVLRRKVWALNSEETNFKYAGYVELFTKTSMCLTEKGVNYVDTILL